MTPALRRAILKLKRYYAERDMCRFGMSHELYRAVIEHGVRTPRQFLEHARTHQLSYNDIVEMLEADAREAGLCPPEADNGSAGASPSQQR